MKKDLAFDLWSLRGAIDSFKRFYEIDVIAEAFNSLKDNSEYNNFYDIHYPIVAKAETEFHFYLSNYLDDINRLIGIAKPEFRAKIKSMLLEDIENIKGLIEPKEILKLIKENNKFEKTFYIHRNGEKYIKYYPRDKSQMLNLRKFKSFIDGEYKNFIDFHANAFISSIKGIIENKRYTEIETRYLSFNINSYIDNKDWPRFISICNYYSDKDNFKDNIKPPIQRYDKTNSYYWVGIKRSIVPALGLFIKTLIDNEIVQVPKVKLRIALSFLEYFGLKEEVKDPKYLEKQIKNSSAKTSIFRRIKEIK